MKVAIIDSGSGGLSILNKLVTKYPYHSYYYFMDNKNMPYGVKDKNIVKIYLKKILDKLEKMQINLLVVACNTMSTLIDELRKDYSYPIYTILDANKEKIKEKCHGQKITIIATSLTIRSEAFNYLDRNIDIDYLNGSLLSYLIEKGSEEEIEKEINTLIKLLNKDINYVLLGCTHYALYKEIFMKKDLRHFYLDGEDSLVNNLPLRKMRNDLNVNILLTEDDKKTYDNLNKFLKIKVNDIHKIIF